MERSEYEFHEKPGMVLGAGIITAALVLAAVILHNFLFAVLVVLADFPSDFMEPEDQEQLFTR